MNIWKIIFYSFVIIPWTFVISLMSFYFHAGQILGHAPSYNLPDPKELSIYTYYSPVIAWSGAIWLYSLIVWFLLTIAYLIIKRKKIQWTPIVLSAAGHFFGILLLFSGIMEWFGD